MAIHEKGPVPGSTRPLHTKGYPPRETNSIAWVLGALAAFAAIGLLVWTIGGDGDRTATRSDTNTGTVTRTAPAPTPPASAPAERTSAPATTPARP